MRKPGSTASRSSEGRLNVAPWPEEGWNDIWGAGFEPGWVHPYGNRLTPVVVEADELLFHVGVAEGSRITVTVEAAWWHDCGEHATVFRAQHKCAATKRRYEDIRVALLPNAVNHVTFSSTRSGSVEVASISYLVTAEGPRSIVSDLFFQAAFKEVTEAEIVAELRRMIEEAKKVSRELAPCLNGNVTLWNGAQSVTGKIDPSGPNTPENTRIRISRPQLREALLALKCAAAEERARIRESITMQVISQLLHEASHRKGIVDGDAGDNIPEEERRNTADLINRLISLLENLESHLPGQPAGTPPAPLGDGSGLGGEDPETWFRRIREIVDRQKRYRWRRVGGGLQPWRGKARRVVKEFEQFKQQLENIRNDGTKTDAQKRQEAEAAFNEFSGKTRADREALEDEFEMDWELGWDPDSLQPVDRLTCRGTFQGRTIPVGIF